MTRDDAIEARSHKARSDKLNAPRACDDDDYDYEDDDDEEGSAGRARARDLRWRDVTIRKHSANGRLTIDPAGAFDAPARAEERSSRGLARARNEKERPGEVVLVNARS